MALIWLFGSPEDKLIMSFDSRHIFSYTCSIETMALSRTETLFFSRWPWSGVSRTPKVKLIMLSYLWPMTQNWCSIVTIAQSRTDNLFFSIWPWSDLSRSPKVKLIMPSDSRHITSFTSSTVTIAQSRTKTRLSADDIDPAFQSHQRSNWLCNPLRDISLPIRVL